MNPEEIKGSIQAIIDGLAPLAQKLQVPLDQLWAWSVKHNYAIAGVNLVWFLVSIFVAYGYYRFIKWGNVIEEGESDTRIYRRDLGPVVIMAGVLVTVILITGLVSLLSASVPRLLAPEWYTANDLIKMIKGN